MTNPTPKEIIDGLGGVLTHIKTYYAETMLEDEHIRSLQAAIDYIKAMPVLSDKDANTLRDTLDNIEVWDGYDKAVHGLLCQFPNDPLSALGEPE